MPPTGASTDAKEEGKELGILIAKLDMVLSRLDKIEQNSVSQTEHRLLTDRVAKLESSWHRNAPVIFTACSTLLSVYIAFHH